MNENEKPMTTDESQFDAEAAQAAQRVVENDNIAYLQQHPNAITDKSKAEEMAYASKNEEESVVEHSNRAINSAHSATTMRDSDTEKYEKKLAEIESKYNSERELYAAQRNLAQHKNYVHESSLKNIKDNLESASKNRKLADIKADHAGKVYDLANDLKNGKSIQSQQIDDAIYRQQESTV